MIHTVHLSAQDTTDADMPLTVAKAKTYLNVYHADDDTLIGDLIQDALDYLERYSGIVARSATGVCYLTKWYSCIRLDRRPVNSITHIKYYDTDGALQTLDSAYYDFETEGLTPMIMINDDWTWPDLDENKINPIIITMDCGYAAADIPKRVRQWLRYTVNDMYNHRDNPVRDRRTAGDRFLETIAPHWI